MKYATCHPHKRHIAKGFCQRCYSRLRAQKRREKIKADPKLYAKYLERRRQENTQQRQRWTAEQRQQASLATLAWIKRNPERNRKHTLDSLKRLKQQTFTAYGDRCACCGEAEVKFLSIHHINGGGSKHRQALGRRGGTRFYSWLRLQGYPSGYQVLCHNCNQALGNYGFCPHHPNIPLSI